MMTTSRQNIYHPPLICLPADGPVHSGLMNNLPSLSTVRMPARIRKGQIESALREVVRHQNCFARMVWELFNSINYRLDCQIAQLEKAQERLWALERQGVEKHGN